MEREIWSSIIRIKDWQDYFEEENIIDEDEQYMRASEINGMYLDDERVNLDQELETEIIVIGNLGCWDGRKNGYKYLRSKNLKDCLYSDCDEATWFVDEEDLICREGHHDGYNILTYRKLKPGLSWKQIDNMEDKFTSGQITKKDIEKYTDSLKPYINKIYGWED